LQKVHALPGFATQFVCGYSLTPASRGRLGREPAVELEVIAMKTSCRLIALVVLAVSMQTYAAQPHMEAALASLLQAKQNLEMASHDKGGYRVAAMKSIDQAIAQVRAGIEYDRSHPSGGEKAKQ
jgi:hypothetical protein